jgi:hypothetical protein
LLLQLENEFPLTPDELAWGSFELDGQRMNRGAATRELLVAALRKEVIEEYSSLLCTCGLNPVFTLAALARSRLCPQRHDSCAILDVTRNHSEWVAFENGVPTAMRIFPWGAEGLNSTDGDLDSVSNSIRGLWTGKTIYLTGGGEEQRTLASNLARALSPGVECQALALEQGEGRSAAILGLKKCIEEDQSSIPLALQVKPEEGKFEWSEPGVRKWAATAAVLLLTLLALPYAEALLLKPFLARKLAALKTGEGRLATIDQEMRFLQFLKDNQPPYLDALYLFAQAAAPGARLDSVLMNRRGEVALRGSMRNSQEVAEFRSKLSKSGFFAEVSFDEQVPTPDRQKVTVRMTAQWKPPGVLELVSVGPTPEEITKAKAAHKEPNTQKSGPSGAPAITPQGVSPTKP